MSSEWAEALTIGELLARDGGSIKTGPFGTALKASEYADVGVPLISVREIGHGTFHLDSKTPRVSEATLARLPEYILQEGDVVFARKGGIERCALIHKHQSGWFLGSDGIRLRPPSTCDVRFIAYSLQTNAVKDWLVQNSTGSTMASLNQATIGRVPIVLPKRHEQTQIADVLEALDDRIALLRETNTTLEAIAQAMFKSWFVDFDPVCAKQQGIEPEGMDAATAALFPDSFEESELGLVPRGWKWVNLETIANVIMGLSPKGDSYNFDGIGVPLINGPVEFGDYFPVQTKWTDSASRFAKKGDLIFCVRGSTTGRRVVSDREYCIGRGVCAIRANNDSSGFIYQTINFGINRLLSKTTGSVFPSLSAPDIKNFQVLDPTEVVISAYENTTKSILLRIQENHHKAQTLATLRDTLLPRLISGQLRLPEAETQMTRAAA